MRIYKLYKTTMSDKVNAAMYEENNATVSFFFKPDTNEYEGFKKDLANGAVLQDSEGVVMTAEQVNQFIETLA